jgi:hypothetical protein
VNDPATRVLCVRPGDYRGFGQIKLNASGTASQRRYLRYDVQPGDAPVAVQRSSRARFESLRIRGDWWVVQGLTVQPLDPATTEFVTVDGADHVLIDGMLVDGASQVNASSQNGIALEGMDGDPATFNTVQRSVVRNGNRSNLPVDYHGILIRSGLEPGEHNDGNAILDNEVYDWGDGIGIGGKDPACTDTMQRGNVIDGNDSYVTPAKYVDCNTGQADPGGECACAENGIEIKANAGPDPADWNRITNNRVWGQRPTTEVSACGGSGATGQAITAGNMCPGHVVVARNVVSDATIGILPAGPHWIIAGNLLHEIRMSNGEFAGSTAINAKPVASYLDIQFNTVVGVDTAYDPRSRYTDTRCNVIVDDQGYFVYEGTRPLDHFTTHNYLYDASPWHFMDATNVKLPTAESSAAEDFCYWRRRWTSPELVCIPFGSTTAQSPHVGVVAQCDPELLEPFGLGRVSWPTATPCADGVDDDGDGLVDAADPGCGPGSPREDPRCQNGLDDDGDNGIDFDGGAAANGGVPLAAPDPDCRNPRLDLETSSGCGLGAELAGLLYALGRLRSRPRAIR